MRGENIGAELKANVLIEHEKYGKGALRVANKFGLDQSTVTRIFQKQRESLSEIEDFSHGEFQKVEMPEENLQNAEEKIAFYKGEAEKYKARALAVEKKLGFLLRERALFRASEIKNIIENHEETEVEGFWRMNHEEFMRFFENFGSR